MIMSSAIVAGCEERSPEPKPRWNPKPEQIRILEAIFNSGMVNPPRDEIRKIRAQLQEYGQVGDANVFYWFQNRKSSKHKMRNLQNSKHQSQQNQQTLHHFTVSSSSSSEKSSPKGANSSTLSLRAGFTQAFGLSELTNVIPVPEQPVGPCTSLLLSEILSHGDSRKEQEERMNMQLQLSYSTVTTAASTHSISPHTASSSATITVPSNIQQIHGVGESAAVDTGSLGRSTVFINDVAFEITVGPFNVWEAFGDDAILINSSGQPVLTNEWGLTLQSLQNGGIYYLVRSLSPFSI
ncbi:hypothetical protein F3Y22_tig00116962pilonHSYRG00885 [Hibiscus syriacus]|uniref:Homeobox domain-containing protein n=1 Tax=Hibiscus syriacus TaxID=106335 RepID=A0A6A2XC31_HIBSY|nr:hypothetical protein F3Y22_tig00116962pilonHSYRG00885 [Hibiscus syriacus]